MKTHVRKLFRWRQVFLVQCSPEQEWNTQTDTAGFERRAPVVPCPCKQMWGEVSEGRRSFCVIQRIYSNRRVGLDQFHANSPSRRTRHNNLPVRSGTNGQRGRPLKGQLTDELHSECEEAKPVHRLVVLILHKSFFAQGLRSRREEVFDGRSPEQTEGHGRSCKHSGIERSR